MNAAAAQAESLSDALLALGAVSVDVLDAAADTSAEQPIFGEPGVPSDRLWQHNKVSALFAQDTDVMSIAAQAAHLAGYTTPPKFHITHLDDKDWVRLTQSQFEPIQLSRRLWIVPTWHTAPDINAINITLDPGLAFGTGSHPTTRLCLAWLDEHIHGGENVLDYGCGSGILAIAALRLGATRATGIDVDPQAVQASRDNAAANNVAAQFFLPDAAPRQQADIVIANILTNPLKILAPLLAQAARTGGQLVLSGILIEQADEVMKIYAPWFNFSAPATDAGWVRLCGVKR
jgi:ribosomal protein L11 methyltransferase